jgi:TATA-binding protein-associated factor Taf7
MVALPLEVPVQLFPSETVEIVYVPAVTLVVYVVVVMPVTGVEPDAEVYVKFQGDLPVNATLNFEVVPAHTVALPLIVAVGKALTVAITADLADVVQLPFVAST